MHDSLADAAATFDAIIGQHIDDSYFGAARVMAPNRLVFGAIDADVTAGRQLTTNWDTVINSIKKNLSEIEHAPVVLDFWANSAAIFAD